MRLPTVIDLLFLVLAASGCHTLTLLTVRATQRCNVESEPPGAEISLNGKYVGTAPCELRYPVGRSGQGGFHVTARLEGYHTAAKSFDEFPAYVLFQMQRAEEQEPVSSRTQPRCDLWNLPDPAARSSLAVLDSQVGADLPRSVGDALADYCRQAVKATDRFVLVDRDNMQALLTEEDFAAAFKCDDTRCLVDFGRKLRAQKIVHGRTHQIGRVYVLTVKMIDVGSATIDAIRSTRVSGSLEELLDIVDPVTCALLQDALGAAPVNAPRNDAEAER